MKKKLYYALLVFFLVIMVGCIIYVGTYYFKTYSDDQNQKEISELIHDIGAKEQSNQTALDASSDSEDNRYKDIIEKYPDFVAWIQIPGTKIDYPVVRREEPETEYYYIDHDFEGNESSSGTLFVNQLCDLEKPSDNIIVYGHNMKAGTMFHDLLKYESKDFYEQNQYITFNTIHEDGLYKVIAAFYTRVSDTEPASEEFFPYYKFIDAQSEQEFNEFVQMCKKLTPYETDEVNYGDSFITLSTCSYNVDDGSGRFVVVAKRLDI